MEEKLYAAIQAYAKDVAKAAIVYDAAPTRTSSLTPTATASSTRTRRPTPSGRRACSGAYNYQYAQKDPGLFAHNPDYAAQFLYDSLEDLAAGGVKVDMTGMVRPAVAK